MENPDVGLGLSNLTLSVHSSLLANIPMLAATIAVNLWVVNVIQRKEKNKLNRLIVWDCFANIVTMVLMLATHSPLLPLDIHLVIINIIIVINTVIIVIIIVTLIHFSLID